MKTIPFQIILLFISLSSITVYFSQSSYFDSLSTVQKTINKQLALTHGIGSQVVWEVSQDSSLKHALKEGSTHSLHSILKQYADTFAFNRLTLYKPDCSLIAGSDRGILLDSTCHQGAKNKDISWWTEWEQSPSLIRTVPIKVSGATLLLELKKDFNLDWALSILAQDNVPLNSLSLAPSQAKFTPIPLGPKFELRLASTILPYKLLAQRPSANWLVLALVAGLCALGKLLLEAKQYLSNLQALERRVQKYFEELLGETPHSKSPIPTLMAELKARWEQDDFHYRQTIQQQRQSIERLQENEIHLKRKLSQLKSQESLQKQIAGGAKQFLSLNQDNKSKLEDIYDALADGLIGSSQGIYKILCSWSRGLEHSSPRKHFRSLSERLLDNGQSQLDQELQTLLAACQKIGSLGMQLGVHSQKLLAQMRQAQLVADHWLNMINPKERPSNDLRDVLLDAQILVPLTEGIGAAKFENLIQEPIPIQHLQIPKEAWTSIFYHAYLTCIEHYRASKEEITVQSSWYIKDARSILIIAAHTPRSMLSRGLEEAKSQLALAQELASIHGLEVFLLPVAEGDVSVAICWPESNQKFSTSSKIASRSRLSSPSSRSS